MTEEQNTQEICQKSSAAYPREPYDNDMALVTKCRRKFPLPDKLLFATVGIVALLWLLSALTPLKVLLFPNAASSSETVANIRTQGQHKLTSPLEGILFRKDKDVTLKSEVTTSLLYSFSPQLEADMKSKFIDPPDENFFYGLGPSVTWNQGEFVVVSRVWLARMKHKLKPIPKFPNNTFIINWLFKQSFDREFKPKDRGALLGIPIPLTKRATDGVMDPRIFTMKNELFVIGQQASFIGRQFWKPHPIIWDLQRNVPILPMAPETDQNRTVFREKNWIPLVIRDELYLFQNMDPMRLLKCDLKGSCSFEVDDGDGFGGPFDFDEFKIAFRGGTSFLEYEWPYFLAVAHGVAHRTIDGEDHRYYSSNLALLRVEPTVRFVYISEDIQFSQEIYKDIEDVKYFGQVPIGNNFVFPISMVFENKNTIAIGAHINDNISVLLRLKGIESLLRAAIKLDQAQEDPAFTLEPWRVQTSVGGMLTKNFKL